MNFEGEFETHITVNLSQSEQWEYFAKWCQSRDLKCVHIVLERGLTASQPMITRHGTGTLAQELGKARELRRECEAAGFTVSRIKLEVAANNPSVPKNTNDVDEDLRRCYFEHHVKLLIDDDIGDLKEAVEQHDAHLSRNARRVRDDGKQERFVTQRCYNVGRNEARNKFQQLLQTIISFDFPIIETEEEFVVFDSNLALDEGWIRKT